MLSWTGQGAQLWLYCGHRFLKRIRFKQNGSVARSVLPFCRIRLLDVVDMFQLCKLDVSSMMFFFFFFWGGRAYKNVYTCVLLEDLDDRLDWVPALDLMI